MTSSDRAPPKPAVAVTGATGFVGSALVPALRQGGHSVRALVRTTGSTAANEEYLVADPDPRRMTEAVGMFRGIQCVVHLAARVHVMRESEAEPLAAFRRVNVDWTLQLARAAAEAGVRRFVFLSSVKVNGEVTAPGAAFTSEDLPAPADPYAISKYEAELALTELGRGSAMDVVIIRPPLVYGPGVKGNFETMMRWLRTGLPLPLGAIDNKRTLLAVGNLVSLIESCLEHSAARGRVLLAGDDEDLSTTELLRRMATALGTQARLIPVPSPVLRGVARLLGRSEIAQRLCANLQVDSRTTRELLGWRPPFRVDEGLRGAASCFLEAEGRARRK